MILAMLLGPHAAFLTMASVLAVQASFSPTAACSPWVQHLQSRLLFLFHRLSLVCRRIVGGSPSAGKNHDRRHAVLHRRPAAGSFCRRTRDGRLRDQRASLHPRSPSSCSRSTWPSASWRGW
jgi:hypothetical protein